VCGAKPNPESHPSHSQVPTEPPHGDWGRRLNSIALFKKDGGA
jgi:hypothetical protein